MYTSEFRIPLDHGYSLYACELKHYANNVETTSTSDPSPTNNEALTTTSNTNNDDCFVIIVVHGGPGVNSHKESLNGLKLLLTLAKPQQAVKAENHHDHNNAERCPWIHAIVFYDQLGCGESSDGPPIPEENKFLYSLSYYVDELDQVIRATQARHSNHSCRFCVLGHSWGGQVVLEYLVQQSHHAADRTSDCLSNNNLVAIISNAPLNETSYEKRQVEIRQALPDHVREFLERDEQEFAAQDTLSATVYRKLIGTSDTNITGEMTGWDALQRLHQLGAHPCLFVTGTNDTVPWQEYQWLLQNLNSIEFQGPNTPKVVILENGDHGPFYGETAPNYFYIIQEFLKETLKL